MDRPQTYEEDQVFIMDGWEVGSYAIFPSPKSGRSPLSVGSLWHWMVFWQWNKSYFIYLTKERWYICMSYLYSTYTTYQFVSKCLLKLAKSCGGNGLMVVLRLPPDLQISTCQWHSMNTFGCTSYTNSCNKKLTVTIPISCDRNHIDIFFGIDLMQLSLMYVSFLALHAVRLIIAVGFYII